MMRLFILLKILLNHRFFSKQNLILSCVCLFGINLAQADVVQRWQDNSGQWHYGDQSAAIGKKAQAVVIKNPISVVKNDQPVKSARINSTKKSAIKKVSARSSRKVVDGNAQHKKQCEELRVKVHHQPSSGKASSLRQNLIQQYERDCIAGNYYAD